MGKFKNILILTLGGLAIFMLVFPYIAWRNSEARSLEVQIVDKTVPDSSYREHRRLIYALNHYKYTNRDSGEYSLEEDYSGFKPLENEKYEIMDVAKSLEEKKDLVYIADTYGVYEEEFFKESKAGERSEIIYGGLQLDELSMVKQQVYDLQTPVVAEFNTFGSPTEPGVQKEMASLLGVKWTGWIGRYFESLDYKSNNELPKWVVESYEKSQGKEWGFDGPGFVIASNKDEVVVLEEGAHFEGKGIDIKFTERGTEFFGTDRTISYGYWFDIVETETAESYADYEWNLTEKGKTKLEAESIPQSFPAITKRVVSKAPLYYFAGDFADSDGTGSFYKYKWLSDIMAKLHILGKNGESIFQWGVYFPVMEAIFEEAHSLKGAKTSGENTIFEEDGLKYISKVEEKDFLLYEGGKWKKKFLKGVNIGAGKPGHFPGDLAITKQEYLKWFEQISDMNADVIRVYTTLKPEFYDALLEHNLGSEKPLYLIQGVWIKEEDKLELMDAYGDNGRIKKSFIKDSKDLVDIIHGDAVLPERPGFASGEYVSDVSEYVIGWIMGIEWDPNFVAGTNENNGDKTSYRGEYLSTEGSPAFEVFMCESGDEVLKYEAEKYGMTRAMSFSNWPTTDMLDHPNEPYEEEDMVEFNMERIKTGERNKSGLFASYHIYPYYPEFMNYQKDYRSFEDESGKKNAYKAYLRDLISHHTMPVMVAEFGVPSSRGKTHNNPVMGFDQGQNSESEQGEMIASLLGDIYDEGYCGALVFTWQDEWFKRTWNTMDLNVADRRPFWSDIQTSEQNFGLMTFEPGDEKSVCYVDGDKREWTESDVLTKSKDISLSVKSDEKYLYLMVESDKLDIEKDSIYIPVDSIQNQGNSKYGEGGLNFQRPADFLVSIDGKDNSRIYVDSYYDSHYYIYGEKLGMMEKNQSYSEKDSGIFNKVKLCLSKEIYLPEDKRTIPFTDYETGKLRYGNGNPDSKSYDSLADFSAGKNMVEIRLPWQLLNVMDPSTKTVMGDFYKKDGIEPESLDGLHLGVSLSREGVGSGYEVPMDFYTWDNWEEPSYHERLKQSYYVLKDAFKDLK